MRMHPKDLKTVLKDNIIKYIYAIEQGDYDEEKGGTKKTWDIVLTDAPMVGRAEKFEEQHEEIPPKPPSRWAREEGEPIVLTEASCKWKYSETFRFTTQKVRALTPKAIDNPRVCTLHPPLIMDINIY